jgi:membrane protein
MWQKTRKTALLLYRAGDHLLDNDGMELAGYLTFLALLSLFPFLVLIVSFAGFVGQGELGAQFIDLIMQHVPHEAVGALRPRIEEIISGPPQGLLTVAILGAIWTASSAVEGMRTVLNRAYQVSEPPNYYWRRLMSILQIVLFTMIIITVMSVLVLAPLMLLAFTGFTGIEVPIEIQNFFVKDFVYVGALLLFLAIASLYYWLPNIKQSLWAVLPGALMVVVLWIAGAAIVTFYLDNVNQLNIIYGSLSSFIATLIFFYVMNVIFIYGAEFNHELLIAMGKKIIEREHTDVSPDKKTIKNMHVEKK